MAKGYAVIAASIVLSFWLGMAVRPLLDVMLVKWMTRNGTAEMTMSALKDCVLIIKDARAGFTGEYVEPLKKRAKRPWYPWFAVGALSSLIVMFGLTDEEIAEVIAVAEKHQHEAAGQEG